MASADATWRPFPIPPAASTGKGEMASMTCGHSTIEAISPQWPPPSVPWHTTKSSPASLCRSACLTDPHSAPTSRPDDWICSTTSAGGVPRALATRRALSWRRMASTCGAAVTAVQPSSSWCFSPSGSSGTPWSARTFLPKSRWPSGMCLAISASSSSGDMSSMPMPSYFDGMTMSTP